MSRQAHDLGVQKRISNEKLNPRKLSKEAKRAQRMYVRALVARDCLRKHHKLPRGYTRDDLYIRKEFLAQDNV